MSKWMDKYEEWAKKHNISAEAKAELEIIMDDALSEERQEAFREAEYWSEQREGW